MKKTVFAALTITLTAAICTPAIFHAYDIFSRRLGVLYTPTLRIQSPTGSAFALADPALGYRLNQGVFRLTSYGGEGGGQSRSFTATLDAEGHRVTSADAPPDGDARPVLAVFGCSYSWGWGVDDRDSFPWLVQREFPAYQVVNFSQPGYGSVHSLVQLAGLVRQARTIEYAVFTYNPFHLERNAAAPSHLKGLLNANFEPARKGEMLYPKASLVDGKLSIDMIKIREGGDAEPSQAQMLAITNAIFAEIIKICKAHGITAVFARQGGSADDPVAGFARRAGFEVLDLAVDLTDDRFTFAPFDPHPNALANKTYAKKLGDWLRTRPGPH